MKKNKFKLYKGINDFIDHISSADSKPLNELTPEEARDFLTAVQRNNYEEFPADIWDTQIVTTLEGNVQLRFIRPKDTKGQKLPLILYCHGGGWVMGDKYTHDELVRKMAVDLNACVAFIDYPRAPEYKFPIALNQVYAALDFLYNSPNEYDIDTTKIILAGDSAGANMALAASMKAKKQNGIKVLYQVLLYPALDINMDSKSYHKYENGPWLTKKSMKWFWNSYISCEDDKKDIYCVPFLATKEDLKDLPSTLIITAQYDVLRDEGEEFAYKLNEAGVKTSCVRIMGTCHDFMMLNALHNTAPVQTAFAIIKGVLSEIL